MIAYSPRRPWPLCLAASVTAWFVLLAPLSAQEADQEQAKQLAAQVRAVLSDRCFHCHGPDSGNRQADLRLDLAGAFIDHADADYAVVYGGEPDDSELLRRVESDDEYEQMPPPESNLSLTTAEKALLRKWIKAGAPWVEHWAFVPPQRIEPPPVAFAGFDHNAIDHFVGRRLKAEGLRPAPRAERATLLRRVTLDLTGLPPTVAELDAYLSDSSPAAYARVVDRLLASPRFGERMAIDWLDAARYADTYGYQNDRFRRVWPWRDWVIGAINRNLPYDEFLTWQLAGDLLPDATDEQRLATTFSRLHRETNEGGSLPAEFRAENVADRTNTLGAAVMGLTLECARCHDHKFDPISQQDYYELFAYFNNTGELGLYSHFTDAVPTPTLELGAPQQQARLAELQSLIARLEAEKADAEAEANLPPAPDDADFQLPDAAGEYGFDQLSEGERLVQTPKQTLGVVGTALLLNGEDGWQGPRHRFRRSEPFSLAVWVRPSVEDQTAVIVHRSQAWLDAAGRGYQLTLDQGRPAAALVHFWPGNALAVRAAQALPLNQWTHLAFTYDGSSQAAGLRLYVDGRPAPLEVTHDSLTRTICYVDGDLQPDKDVRLTVGHRFRDAGFKGGAVDELRVYREALTPIEMLRLSNPDADNLDDADRRRHLLARHNPSYARLLERLTELRTERDELRDAIPQIPVMAEAVPRRASYVLLRGAYNNLGDPVDPTPLSQVGADLPSGEQNRLGLARWLTHPRHPLTARVAVNRIWQALFGRGLVATANDFGSQGAPPTHPQLLDHLAVDFIQGGWDLKQLVRTMVSSATYQQASHASEELLAVDPENQLLARGPSGRLPAEMLRDTALATSGMLEHKMGGPPVHPFQPPGLWEEKGAARYARDAGEGSHRRSVYTIWKRTSPPPSMMTFDAADREVCVMQRQATATPLQALVMLNDPQYVEAACGLAYRVREGSDAVQTQLGRMFRIATSRAATPAEEQVLLRLYQEQRRLYAQNPADAIELLSVGDLPDPKQETAVETAAMASVALAILNHDATVTKR